jgi:hypothetical protein
MITRRMVDDSTAEGGRPPEITTKHRGSRRDGQWGTLKCISVAITLLLVTSTGATGLECRMVENMEETGQGSPDDEVKVYSSCPFGYTRVGCGGWTHENDGWAIVALTPTQTGGDRSCVVDVACFKYEEGCKSVDVSSRALCCK